MATRINTKRKAKSKSRKQAKAAGKERRPDGLVVGSDAAKLVDAICNAKGATHAELKKLVGWKSCPTTSSARTTSSTAPARSRG